MANLEAKAFVDDINNSAPTSETCCASAAAGAQNRFQGNIEDVRVYNRALSAAEAAVLADSMPIAEIAAMPEAKRSQARYERSAIISLKMPRRRTIRAAWKQERERAGEAGSSSRLTFLR